MSDDDVRAALRIAMADEPALSFDPDSAAASARTTVRRRRAVIATGALTAILAAGAITAVSTWSAGPTPPVGGITVTASTTPPTPVTTTVPGPATPTDGRARQEILEHVGRRLTEVDSAVTDPVVVRVSSDPLTFGPEMFIGMLSYRDEIGLGTIIIDVRPDFSYAPCTELMESFLCEVRDLPDGSTIEIIWRDPEPPEPDGSGMSGVTVNHFRADGVWVGVRSHQHQTGEPFRPEPPFTVEQLIAIATDPEIRPTA